MLSIDKQPKTIDSKKEKLNSSFVSKKSLHEPILWYDLGNTFDASSSNILSRLGNTSYSGIILASLAELKFRISLVPSRLDKIIRIESLEELEQFEMMSETEGSKKNQWIIASQFTNVLNAASSKEIRTCLCRYIDDNKSLNDSIEEGRGYNFLLMRFKDPTNIPLELAIASLQFSSTYVIKEILNPEAIDDAVVSLDTMEVGADGVVFTPHKHEILDSFLNKLESALYKSIKIEIGEITKSIPVGVGHRACIDLATLFTPDEGILVGSTSTGGFLCCPEVFHLPYMELRPFRVNAGGVHSYVYNLQNKTNYISELKAGDPIMVVDTKGKIRRSVIGRVKIEVRPLRLIEAKFNDVFINILLQDDWHVRIYSDQGTPLNISDLKIGQKVLGFLGTPGRHVGIQVEENILEK